MQRSGGPAIDIHRADPHARRLAAIGLAAALLGGALLLWWLQSWLTRLAPGDPSALDVLLWSTAGVTLLTAAVGFAAAGLLWQIGSRSLAEARFPPATLRTVRDVPIRRGDAARRSARACQAGAVAVALLATGVLAWLVWTSLRLG